MLKKDKQDDMIKQQPKKLTMDDVCFALLIMRTEERNQYMDISTDKLSKTIKNFESALSQYNISIKGDENA